MSQQDLATQQLYDDEIDLVELFLTLLRYWKLITIIVIISTLLSVYYALGTTKIYKASAVFYTPKTSQASPSLGMLSSIGLGSIIGNADESIVLELINSDRMAKNIVNHFDFQKILATTDGKKSEKKERISAEMEKMKQAFAALIYVKGNLVANKNKSSFITLSFDDPNPELAAKVVNFAIKNLDVINEELEISAEKPMVKVVDAAESPLYPYKPNRKMIVIISIISSGIFSVFLAFLLEFVKNLKSR
jgi:uncharacterized protein involved in exopolysaccharide biosynthesis